MTARTTVSPTTWSEAFSGLEQVSPWPGPRPLTESDSEAHLLVGRLPDLMEFIDNIQFSSLTHLTGFSGVGKSSLLLAGIVPTLRSKGFTVVTCRDWRRPKGMHFDIFLAKALYDSLPVLTRDPFSATTDLFWDLEERGSAVIILDQFEELIRQGAEAREEAFEFIADLIDNTNISVVLSYRTEHLVHVKKLDRDIRIPTVRNLELRPVSNDAGLTLIEQPRRPDDAPPDWSANEIITPEARQLVHQLWIEGRSAVTLEHLAVGLLHLQALLFVLHSRADGRCIEPPIVSAFVAAARDADMGTPAGIMSYALQESAERRISLAIEAAEQVGLDDFVIRGAAYSIAKTLPHLSSGGFKLDRNPADLAEIVFDNDLESAERFIRTQLKVTDRGTHFDPKAARLILKAITAVLASGSTQSLRAGASADATPEVMSLLGATREQIALVADSSLGGNALGLSDWHRLLTAPDNRDITSGPMMGLSPVAAYIEQMRRFGWAVTWLGRLNLARVITEGDERTTLTLIHDGFGEPLGNWSVRYLNESETWGLYALTVPQGENHEWTRADYQAQLSGTRERPRFHLNLGFKGNAIIGAQFANAVFVNCDLRGTLFLGCTFDAVTMLNCRLDGALFSDCTVSAAVNRAKDGTYLESEADEVSEDRLRRPPRYLIDVSGTRLAQTHALYRELSGDFGYFLSPEPGSPAVPVAQGSEGESWRQSQRGLLIQGSRLSALTIRGTRFTDEAAIVFDRVRGSGIDLAELSAESDHSTAPRIKVTGSILRHVAFTSQTQPRTVFIDAEKSVLSQWWVGELFEGSLDARDSLIAHMWIDSGRIEDQDQSVKSPTFAASVDNCTVTGMVGFASVTETAALPVTDHSDHLPAGPARSLKEFRESSARMDYARQ
jgi:hypothetical protein